jgi:hypothetical protein
MKKPLYVAMFAASFCATMSSVKADDIDTHRVLGQEHTSDHVIDLALRHGVNNSVDLSRQNIVHDTGYGPMLIPDSEIGDLELIQIEALSASDPAIGNRACGTKFAVVVRNDSTRDVCGFRISAVALLGRICSTSPTAVVKVDKICAGESMEIHIQLPIESLAMGNRNGTVVGFRRLLVAIDSFDQFVEDNEANNIQVFDLASIATRVASIEPMENSTTPPLFSPKPISTEVGQSQSTTSVKTSQPAKDDLQSAMQQISDARATSAASAF